ncbi:MAG: dioxygenase [Actinomycetales bacterium]|nr:dioxygenase [Actinomycetales bacterium]
MLPEAQDRSRRQRQWAESDAPLPVMFLSHGAPPLFDDGPWMSQLLDWSTSLPKPRAIVIISAHWESAPLSITAPAAGTPLVYDFGGFAPRYYQMQYATPDASELAGTLAALMPGDEPLHQHSVRGLDHGAWVPLKVMYPLGDVPVIQLSLPTHDPHRLMEIGRRLRPLREQGVLVIGSGFMTHGLPFLTADMMHGGQVPGWSADFDAWAQDAAERRDLDALAGYRHAPGMPYAHPSPEHFSPLFVAWGAAGDDACLRSAIDGYMWGLSKRSLQFD